MLLTLVVLIVVLGLVIFVHELGHFLAAKAVGVQVLRFSIGFGPPIVSWRRGETEYWIASVPLGGYVKMAGLEEEELTDRVEGGAAAVPIDPARTLESKSVPARLLVMLAGVTMNVVLAYVLFTGVLTAAGRRQLTITPIDSVVADAVPESARELARLAPGDSIVTVNGEPVRTWDQVYEAILSGPREFRLEVGGRPGGFAAQLPVDDSLRLRVARALRPRTPPKLGIVIPGDPAHRAGLQPGDVIARVNGDTLASWSAVVEIVRRSPGDTLRFTVVREGVAREVVVVPRLRRETDAAGGRPGVDGVIGAEANPPLTYARLPLLGALSAGAGEVVGRTGAVLVFLKGLVVGDVSLRDVGGPVLIAQLSGQAARLGIVRFIDIVAFISLNLAVLNLLPIPVLDGGHVMFLLIEAARGRPLSLTVRLRLTQIGFVVLVVLMVFAISNDVLRNLAR